MSKLNAVLDLDNSLICSVTMDELKDYKISKKLKYIDMEDYYRVFARPYLDKFLDFLFENFEVSIWTAASRSYMFFVVEKFILTKPERKIKLMLCDVNCDQSRKMYNPKTPKDLRYIFNFKSLGFHACNTFIIDDLAYVKIAQPAMAIQCPYFDCTEKNAYKDRFLKDVIDILIHLVKLYRQNHCTH